jgi:hypothetical protein
MKFTKQNFSTIPSSLVALLSGNALRLLLILLRYDYIYPDNVHIGYDKLAIELNAKMASILKAKNELIEKGLIREEQVPFRRTSNKFILYEHLFELYSSPGAFKLFVPWNLERYCDKRSFPVLVLLAEIAVKNSVVEISDKRLAELTGQTTSTIKKAIIDLAAMELIEADRRNGLPGKYLVDLEKLKSFSEIRDKPKLYSVSNLCKNEQRPLQKEKPPLQKTIVNNLLNKHIINNINIRSSESSLARQSMPVAEQAELTDVSLAELKNLKQIVFKLEQKLQENEVTLQTQAAKILAFEAPRKRAKTAFNTDRLGNRLTPEQCARKRFELKEIREAVGMVMEIFPDARFLRPSIENDLFALQSSLSNFRDSVKDFHASMKSCYGMFLYNSASFRYFIAMTSHDLLHPELAEENPKTIPIYNYFKRYKR